MKRITSILIFGFIHLVVLSQQPTSTSFGFDQTPCKPIMESNENYFYISTDTILAGSAFMLRINMFNDDEIKAIQFDLTVPEGFVIDPNGASLTDRKENHSLSAAQIDSSTFRFLSFSLSNTTFSDHDGTLINIPVTMDAEIAAGSYLFLIDQVVITDIINSNVQSDPDSIGYIFIEELMGLNAIESAKIHVYPNPFSNELKILLTNAEQANLRDLSLMDLNGKIVYKTSIDDPSMTIYISSLQLQPGAYIMNLSFRENGNYRSMIFPSLLIKPSQ